MRLLLGIVKMHLHKPDANTNQNSNWRNSDSDYEETLAIQTLKEFCPISAVYRAFQWPSWSTPSEGEGGKETAWRKTSHQTTGDTEDIRKGWRPIEEVKKHGEEERKSLLISLTLFRLSVMFIARAVLCTSRSRHCA